ncbi:MAG: septum formation initiator family protein [Bacteroidetes bacterium]|nr:septum formation initiator family protein [Bacteroidota bacterium]
MQKIIAAIWPILKNKYYVVMLAFVVWISFFDGNNVYEIYKFRVTYHQLQKERNFYLTETAKVNAEKQELFSNEKSLEKFARERYFMKRDDEDIYIFETVNKAE